MSENPNIALVQRFFVAYSAHDLDKMRQQILAPDVTWRIPGHHPVAGVKRGANEILAYLALAVVGVPLAAAAAGWLLAGREPPAISRTVIE